MSVIVKGVEIPKNCAECPLNYDMMSCMITGTRWWSDTMVLMDFDCQESRLYDCPLVELPEHHGELIDVDALIEIYSDRMEKVAERYGDFSSEAGILSGAMKLVYAQPIIVEEE